MPGLTQTQSGKGFEYAMTNAMHKLIPQSVLTINNEHTVALSCYNLHSPAEQHRLDLASNAAVSHLLSLEPRLSHGLTPNDQIILTLQPDSAGKAGDVRDIIMLRSQLKKWEIGISCKNNHADLKHSRISPTIDIGKEWMLQNSTQQYWQAITPVFNLLNPFIANNDIWENVPNKDTQIYQALLVAFCDELLRLEKLYPSAPNDMAQYILGRHDFYKVMRYAKKVNIQAFNLYGTLGKSYQSHRGLHSVAHLKLPTRFLNVALDPAKPFTHAITALNNGWTFSFRIHNGDKQVKKSLKFAVSLIGHPQPMHSHAIAY